MRPDQRHLGLAQVVRHPARGEISLVGQPVSLSRTPSSLDRAAPDLGAQTDEILAALGYDPDRIADLRRRAII